MNKATFLKRASELSPHIVWAEVAKRAHVSKNTMSAYLNGNGEVIETMENILDAANSIFRAKKNSINAVPSA